MLPWRAAQRAPVGAPSAHCCGGAEEYKGCDGEEEEDGDAAAALPSIVGSVKTKWLGAIR